MGTTGLVTHSIALLLLVSCTQAARVPIPHEFPEQLAIKPTTKGDASYLLPTAISPTEYVITVTPNFNDFTFAGEVSIKVKAVEETNVIKLHWYLIEITDVKVHDEPGNELAVDQSYDEVRNIWSLTLKDNNVKFTKDSIYIMTITYTGKLTDDMEGFYRSSYKVGDEERWLATTHFESAGARRAFPCFDEPHFKATFQVNVIRDDSRKSISNTVLDKTEEVGGLKKDVFKVSPLMSTYLVAFIVSDFKSVENVVDGRTFRVWARDGAQQQSNYSVSISPELIKFMEDFTGVKYEFSKMEEAAIPDFAPGAMENWGLVTYRERALLYDPDNSTTANKMSVASTIAHEFAHQWFGDLVSPAWWKYIWLNEGFATYFEHHATTAVLHDWRLEEQFVVDTHQNALQVDAASSHAITTDVYTVGEVDSIFDSIVYDKAGSVIRMTEHFLTTDTFKAGLTSYLNTKQHSAATEDDLFNAWNEQQKKNNTLLADLNVADILHSWTQQVGYPLITVSRTEDNKTRISQQRFLLHGEDTDDNTRWYVPISFTTSQDVDFSNTSATEWMRKVTVMEVSSVPLLQENDWVILNIQETGFYRVMYDELNYKNILDYLHSENRNKIHVLNRAQLIDDALNLARAGKLSYATALDITAYLVHEVDYIPWTSYFNSLSFLNSRFAGTPAYDKFKLYARTLLEPVYSTLKFQEPQQDEPEINKLHRNNVLTWACNFDHSECVNEAKTLFNNYKNSGTPITPDLRSVAYCVGVREGGKEAFDFLWSKYLESDLSSEQVLILNALGCATETDILTEYLNKSIDSTSGVRMQDSASVFAAVYSRPQGVSVALQFLEKHFDEIKTYYKSMNAIGKIFSGIASQISTLEQREQFTTFVFRHTSDLGESLGAAMAGMKTASNNADWYEKYSEQIQQWVEQETATTVSPNPTGQSTESTTPDSASSVAISIPLCLSLLLALFLQNGN